MPSNNSRTIKVDYLARVEGEGALYVKVRDDQVHDVELRIFEPPRFFEAFLRDRKFTEAPDITARICGICPIAYQSASITAMESICGITVEKPIRELRRLMYCGEWIESHVLHIAMLHAPDFLGYQDAIEMAGDHPEIVQTALKLKKIGNEVMTLLGGREIHPINLRVGGFYSVPTKAELKTKLEDLKWAREAALGLVKFTASLDIPDFERDYEYVCLKHPDEYPLWEGRLISNKGLDIPIDQFYDHIQEEQVRHSTSYHSVIKDRGAYHVGPNARYTMNYDQLSPLAQEAAKDAGLGKECYNPFMSIVVRAVETVYALDEAIRIIEEYEMPSAPYVEPVPRAGRGHGCSEAPRGICYHTYEIDDEGLITSARIAPPTAQNQRTIEEDLREFVPGYLDLNHEDLTWKCEQAVRNYDPCISCSCHFLKLDLDRD